MTERREDLDCQPVDCEDEIDLRELFAKLWASKWLILSVSLGLGLAVGCFEWLKPPVYEVKAVIKPAALGFIVDGSPRYIENSERIVAILKANVIRPSDNHDLVVDASVIAGTDFISLRSRIDAGRRSGADAALMARIADLEHFYAPMVEQAKGRQNLIDMAMAELIERRSKLASRLKGASGNGLELAILCMAMEQNTSNLIALQTQSIAAVAAPAHAPADRQRFAAPRAIEVIQPPSCSGPLATGAGRKAVLGSVAGFLLTCLGVLIGRGKMDSVA